MGLVGDRWKDISLNKMNLITFLLDLGYNEKKVNADFEYKTFTQIVNQIIKLKNENISNLKVKIFADGANKEGMLEMYNKDFIMGLTTNPTLMKKVGIKDYEFFAKSILSQIKDKPISFEVFSDEIEEMEIQVIKLQNGVIMFMLKFL